MLFIHFYGSLILFKKERDIALISGTTSQFLILISTALQMSKIFLTTELIWVMQV